MSFIGFLKASEQQTHKVTRSVNGLICVFQETLRALRVKRQSSGSSGALQQADERGSLLHSLLKNADAIRTSGLSCSHAGQKLLS